MQAARGTSVAVRNRFPLLFSGVAGTAYTVDQVSKVVAVEHLTDRDQDVRVVGDLLTLHLTYNPGAAFSAGTGLTPVISVVAILATLGVLWFSRRIGDRVWAVALGLLLAGVVGNLTDRLLRDPGVLHGHVVDFLRLPNWPVFNVADVCINVAAGLIILQALRGVRLDGTRDRDHADDDGGDDEGDDTSAGASDGETAPVQERAE